MKKILYSKQELYKALEESVLLQSHYAKLLNGYDLGERMIFSSVDKWLNRLRDLGKIIGDSS